MQARQQSLLHQQAATGDQHHGLVAAGRLDHAEPLVRLIEAEQVTPPVLMLHRIAETAENGRHDVQLGAGDVVARPEAIQPAGADQQQRHVEAVQVDVAELLGAGDQHRSAAEGADRGAPTPVHALRRQLPGVTGQPQPLSF
ncbi:hypothetical protein HP532_12365 [Pseudomonas sp. CrR25]|nr:hypothetical protein [Pseudomonas sp. CrR25]